MTLLTPKEVASAAKLSEATVLRLCRTGEIPGARKVGSSWRIVESQFDAWFEGPSMVDEPRPARGLTTTTEDGGRW